jgi:hypothetical protein
MASLAFSRLGWASLARALAPSDSDLALAITALLTFDRSAFPRMPLPHPVSRRITEEWTRLDRSQRAREWGIRS